MQPRGCLGKYLARNTVSSSSKTFRYPRILTAVQLWLMIASVLACFNLRKPKDENGQEMEISDEFEEEGLMGCVHSFNALSRLNNRNNNRNIDEKPRSNAI